MKIKVFFSLLILGFFAFVINTLLTAGFFRTINPHSEGKIKKIYTNIYGTEDFAIDTMENILYISSTDRRGKEKEEDGIYILDLTHENEIPRKLEVSRSLDFHPHGISLFKEGDVTYLFAINHCDNYDGVEVFKVDSTHLVHLETIIKEDLCCPNDLVVVSRNTFYITNDHGYPTGIMRTLEDYKVVSNSGVYFYNGEDYQSIKEGLAYANGINVDLKKNRLYFVETTGQYLHIYNGDIKSGEVEIEQKVKIKTGLDNIEVDNEGNLWIGCHPQLLKFVAHSQDKKNNSPSQAIVVYPEDGFKWEEKYLDDGSTISGSSVALYHKDELFIGVVFDPILLRIDLEL